MRAADAIVSELENQIMSGQLRDRSLLPAERELMEQFGTSRTVIREAISALTNRGFLESKPRFRPVVRKPDYATLLDASGTIIQHLVNDRNGVENLYLCRVFVESGLVRQAALSASRDHIAALKLALEANHASMSDSDAFYQTDQAFHGVLYEITGNPIFPALHQGFTSWLAPQWQQMERSPERNRVNYEAHSQIYQSILERDPDAAEEALRAHLKIAWEYVRDTFDEEHE